MAQLFSLGIIRTMRAIQYLIIRFALFFFFVLVTSPVPLVAGALLKYCDAHEQFQIFRWVFIGILLVWLFGLPWLTNRAAQHMAFEDRKFGEAVKCAFYDLRLRLAFLPVIGHWFEPESRDDDDHDA